MLYLDVVVLDADGGVEDAAIDAVYETLQQIEVPAVAWDETTGAVVDVDDAGEKKKRVLLPLVPTEGSHSSHDSSSTSRCSTLGSLTCGLFGGRCLVDVTADEEMVVDTLVRCCVDRDRKVVRHLSIVPQGVDQGGAGGGGQDDPTVGVCTRGVDLTTLRAILELTHDVGGQG